MKDLFSNCCNAQAMPFTRLSEDNEGLCPLCNDMTDFIEIKEESNQDKICGPLAEVFRRPNYNELYVPKNENL